MQTRRREQVRKQKKTSPVGSGTYNRCPYCNSLRKRHMPFGDQKICIDCYEEFAGSAWVKEQKEKDA